MELSFIEEFKKSWLTSIIGFILAIAGSWLLAWNEGRAVHHAHSLDEAYENAIPLNIYEPIRSEFDGKLVHVSGNLLIDEPLTEPEYSISIQSVKMKRRVQMYQWVEERVQSDYGGDATDFDTGSATNDYFYVTEWRDKLVNSNSFYIRHGHLNPTEIPLKTHIYVSPSVRVGQLTLGTEIKDKFTDYIEMTSDERPERRDIKLHLGIYYHCDDVWKAEVGDIRIQFYYAGVNGEPVSIIGMQKDGMIVPYFTTGNHEIALLRHGNFNVKQMFNAEHTDARLATWKLRGIGCFMLYASSVMLSTLIRIFFAGIPVLRRAFSGEATSSGNFAVALSVALNIIAIAWIAHRPMIAIGLLTVALSPYVYAIISDAAQIGHTD